MNNQNTTATEVTTVTTTATTENATVKQFPTEILPTFETITISDFLDMDIAVPVYQRPFVWTLKQIDGLVDSILKGLPIPPVIVADIYKDDNIVAMLLIDGVQRKTAIEKAIEGLNVDNTDDSDIIDAILSHSVSIMHVRCDNATVAAQLFIKYNSGSVLNGIQKAKANLPEDIILQVKPYIDFCQSFGKKKLGKVTPDTAAMMLAASISKQTKMNSNGSNSAKILNECDHVAEIPEILYTLRDVVLSLDSSDIEYVTSPARLIPLSVALINAKSKPTAEQLKVMLSTFNPSDKTKYYVYTTSRGKNPMTTKTPTKIAEAFSNTSNATKATMTRYYMYCGMIADIMTADTTTADTDTKTVENAINDLIGK